MKILVTDAIAEIGVEMLKRFAEVDVRLNLTPQQLLAAIGNYDALIVRSQTKVTADIIEAASRLRVIGRAGVGVDNINVEAATRQGIVVVNSPQGNIISTAEHTIAMLLAVVRQIPPAHSQLHAGKWNRKLKGIQVRGKTLGIIGMGRVGTEVAKIVRGLQTNVIAYDPLISGARAEKLGVQLVTLEELMSKSDFITVHVPLNASTQGLIGKQQLKLVKPSAIIVNCARGGIVDEAALYEALEGGTLAGAAVDVFTHEPALDNILLKSDKVITTPHLAASTDEAEISASRDIAEDVEAVLKGYPPKSPVNAPSISVEELPILTPYLKVGTVVGKIAVQLASGNLNSLTIRYEGEIAGQRVEAVRAAVLSGLLGALTEEQVNMINAGFIAEKRGLVINEFKNAECENFTNMLTLEVHSTTGNTLVAGTWLRGKTYLARVNNYWLEMEPLTSHLLFTEHKDRPGMIGAVGTIIGSAGVNISQMQVSLGIQRGSSAMMVLSLDEPLSPETFRQILAIPGMDKATLVQMG